MDSLTQFKEWCKDAYSYLEKEYNFIEDKLLLGEFENKYQVVFSNNEIKLKILGEGHCTIAAISFFTQDGTEVYYQSLAEDWKPFQKAKKKKKEVSQKDQIYESARVIKEKYNRILQGDYSHLDKVAERLKNIRQKMNL